MITQRRSFIRKYFSLNLKIRTYFLIILQPIFRWITYFREIDDNFKVSFFVSPMEVKQFEHYYLFDTYKFQCSGILGLNQLWTISRNCINGSNFILDWMHLNKNISKNYQLLLTAINISPKLQTSKSFCSIILLAIQFLYWSISTFCGCRDCLNRGRAIIFF